MKQKPIYDKTAIDAALSPLGQWVQQCHAASVRLVQSGAIPGARVARGTCRGVGAQHSWVVAGHDVYAHDAQIIDPTLWSYDKSVVGIWYGSAKDGRHIPHGGRGSIWTYGRPAPARGPVVKLTPKVPLGGEALRFLDMLGPLDRDGWMILAQSPVTGWPAAEIIAAMDDTKVLTALVPIDRLGMLTDRNPGGLYLSKVKGSPR
jgi:hypothetical protein